MTGPLARHPRRHLGSHGLLAAALAALVGLTAPGARAQEISDEARQHFRAGVNYLQDPDGERIEEAYVEFKRAYEISKSPKVLGNIGLCAIRLERDGEALDAYTRYLSSATGITAEEREQIERDLQTLTASAVRLTITADVKEATIVDARYPVRGAPVTNRYALRDGKAEIIVRAGHHVVRLQTEGSDRGQWQFDALGGTAQSKHFQVTKPAAGPEPAAGPGGGAPVVPWVLVGVGSAALIGGGVTGFLTLRNERDLEKLCPDDLCPLGSDYESKKSSTKTLALTTDVLLISGGVMAAVGAGWLLFGSKGATKGATSGMVVGGAACTPGGCAATIGGRFLTFAESSFPCNERPGLHAPSPPPSLSPRAAPPSPTSTASRGRSKTRATLTCPWCSGSKAWRPTTCRSTSSCAWSTGTTRRSSWPWPSPSTTKTRRSLTSRTWRCDRSSPTIGSTSSAT
ncbi:MAG TPA: hypothetical protein VFS43_45920 [Polyangiaceae bacterium]|nr:hypothetical protein [Polyangiaceae bacterium]